MRKQITTAEFIRKHFPQDADKFVNPDGSLRRDWGFGQLAPLIHGTNGGSAWSIYSRFPRRRYLSNTTAHLHGAARKVAQAVRNNPPTTLHVTGDPIDLDKVGADLRLQLEPLQAGE